MANVIALGEALIDFTPSGRSDRGRLQYECNPGGAPANMLSCLTQFGHVCRMIACVGQDAFGDEIVSAMEGADIDCRYVERSAVLPTTLAVVSLNQQGDRSFSFYRDNCADVSIRPESVTAEMLEDMGLAHVGSVSMTHEPVRSATRRLAELARERGVPVSYDPNYRPLLWSGAEAAREQIVSLLPLADFVKVSDEEAVLIAGCQDPAEAARQIVADYPNIRALFLTLGAEGSRWYLQGGESGYAEPVRGADIVDTTGAGDYFFAGALSRLLESGLHNELTAEIMTEACARGNECGYRVAQVRGALGVKIR